MKKKGLIISTVVMVVVLIASLTTATYAWFNSQAQATVDDLTITTNAATGLQIAMTQAEGSTGEIFSGELTYNNGWSGAVNGWGNYLGFSDIKVGELEHAVTVIKSGTVNIFVGYKAVTVAELTNTVDFYEKKPLDVTVDTTDVSGKYEENSSHIFVLTADTLAQEGKTYYEISKTDKAVDSTNCSNFLMVATETKTIGTDEGFEAGYYQAVAYDSKTQPIGYKKVDANQTGTYYYLTMAVTNVKAVNQLGFSVEVVPSGTSNVATNNGTVDVANNPGMAAASRIEVKVAKAEAGKTGSDLTWETSELQPFEAWSLNPTTKTMTKGTDAANKNSSGKYTYALGSNVGQDSVYFVTMRIWVEGNDKECNNITTGTAMQFKINFVFAETGNISDWGVTGTDITAIKSFS